MPRERRTSCTTCCGCAATCASASSTRRTRRSSRRSGARSACASRGEERLIAAEDAGRYRDALGVDAAVGPADVVPRGRPGLAALARARATRAGAGRSRPPQATAWFGVDVEQQLRELEREEKLVRGELRPGGTEREWCDPDVLRRLRRASLAALRREVEPAEQAALGRFLPSWHGIDRRASLREALDPAAGARAAGVAVGVGGAAAPRARLPAGAARPALRVGRARLGRRRARPRRRLLPRRRAAARPAVRPRRRPRARRTTRSARRSRAARSSGPTCSPRRSSRTRSRCPRSGISSGRAR